MSSTSMPIDLAFTIFVLAILCGIAVISKVPATLHTPLMSGANSIHGIVLVGAMIVAGPEGFRKGAGVFFDSFSDPDTMAAVKLTLLVAAIAVPFNALVGIAASWAIAKFNFVFSNFKHISRCHNCFFTNNYSSFMNSISGYNSGSASKCCYPPIKGTTIAFSKNNILNFNTKLISYNLCEYSIVTLTLTR